MVKHCPIDQLYEVSMSYSTNAKIRDEAGFTNNANITDDYITRFQSAATSQIDGIISRKYSLPLSETPELLEQIERKLAAGHLMLDEYGAEAEGTGKDGQKKVDWAESMLAGIEEGLIQLIGSDGAELTRSEKVELKGFPDDSAGEDRTPQGDKDDPPITEIGMIF